MNLCLLRSFVLTICIFNCSAAFGQVQTYNVLPNATDAAIDQALEVHYVAVDRSVSAKNRLLVFFPGTGGTPRGYKTFTEVAADKGFHAVALRYVNDEAVNDLCGGANSDLDCYEKVRLEVIDGTNRTPLVNVNRPNSVENRLIKLLKYMHVNYPNDGWRQYLDTGDNILWDKTVVAGHSQGGGHAGILGKKHRVARVIMFAAADYNASAMAPANWITAPGITPNADFYGFTHRRDEQVNYNLLTNRIWTAYGMTAFGAVINVDTAATPYNNTHTLYSDYAAIPGGSNYHGAIVVDTRFPIVNNAPLYQPVWEYLLNVPGRTNFDFDGDGRADLAVFRPSNGVWYVSQSSDNAFTAAAFGVSTDKLAPADYDGDGVTDLAVFRNGVWYLNRSSLGFTGVAFGTNDDVPAPADYDGDGKADLAVFRPSNGIWYLQRSQLGFAGIQFGQAGDKPAAADYDGDGKADLAVFRGGVWYINRSTLGFVGISFGVADDRLVPADYDGDGVTDIAVFRPSNGTWYLNRSQLGITGIQFGAAGDAPTAADYDGDGKADLAVFRSGVWYLNRTSNGFTGIAFGAASDKPIPNAFVR